MKRFALLLTPLMAITLLANCGGAKTYTFTFNCSNCKVYDEHQNEITTIKVPASSNLDITYKKFVVKNTDSDNYILPLKCDISVKKVDQEDAEFEYDSLTGVFFVPIIGDLNITIPGFKKGTTLDESSWAEISEISTTGRAKEFFSLGEEKIVTVNKQPHHIRIIGFNHDILSNSANKTAGITFEFANLLSDEEGYSLATPWDSEDGESTPNYNYLNSNLRKAFDGNANASIFWARKGQWSEATEEPYYHKTVLDMLPSDLRGVLKEVRKEVTIYNNSKNEYEVNKTDYNTTIFPLSYAETNEVSNEEALKEGSIYELYKGEESLIQPKRVKYQVKWHDGALKYDEQTIIEGRGVNVAGYNNETNEYGAPYWLRSPKVKGEYYSMSAFFGYDDGSVSTILSPKSLHPIAPAFCI